MMYDWLFTPDDADIAASNGYDLGVRGGEAFKTESRANLARQALDEGMRQNRNDYCDSCNLP